MVEKTETEQAEIIEKIEDESDSYKRRVITFLVLGVLGVFLILGALLYFLVARVREEEVKLSEMEAEFRDSMQEEIVRVTNPIYFDTQKYRVNLRDGKHYLQLSAVFVMQDPQVQIFLEGWRPIVDDTVISILKKETIDNLRTRPGLELLKREFLRRMNQLLVEEYLPMSEVKDRFPIKDILFTEFDLK